MSESASTPATVADLAGYRTRRHEEDADEAAGRLLFEQLRAEANDFIAALVAGGAL